jgi:2-polyprenyl-3-methyl-5-hydroxy-6-metoxy-1,4-benzoquinol methylase
MSFKLLEETLGLDGRDVLDVGCGEGALARRLAGSGARVTGIDPLAQALENARAAGAETQALRYVEGVAQELPFAEQSFDVLIFFNSLHHIPVESMGPALREAARVLRPQGVLYVQEPLAEGTAFELLRPVNDETAVRAAALQALDAAAAGELRRLDSRQTVLTVRHADLAALRARTLSVDPERAARFDAHHEEIRAAFERLGRPAEGGGREFEQPFRIELLERRGP